MTDTDFQRAVRRLDRLLATIRSSIDETIPVQIAHTFVIVARNEGKGVVELAEIAGTNKSTMSRHLLDLSESLRSGQPGYGLLIRASDPGNLRSVLYTLSPRGKLLLGNLVGVLED
jgi:DNA-binding MarR family transcriptional regulator